MYLQYDREGKLVTNEDLQNKSKWCREGEKIENVFVHRYGNILGLRINPDKKFDPFAPDLLDRSGKLADLKTQNTPFFKARKLFAMDPGHTIVFNRKDVDRYSRLYPDLNIYFWVEWHSVKFIMGSFETQVEYLNGVWKIPFAKLLELVKKAPEHTYSQRKNDRKGNARSSYVLNLQQPGFEKCIQIFD